MSSKTLRTSDNFIGPCAYFESKDPPEQYSIAIQTASPVGVLEILDIGGGLVDGGIEPPGLGLAQKIIDQVNELAGGVGDFGDHGVLYEKSFLYGERGRKLGRRAERVGTVP